MKKVSAHGNGDHYVHIKIVIPKSLSKKQKAVLQAYAEIEDDTPGQIYGIANNKDGKPNDKKTQEIFKSNREFDEKDPNDGKYNLFERSFTEFTKDRFWFSLGFAASVFLATIFLMQSNSKFDNKPVGESPGENPAMRSYLDRIEKQYEKEQQGKLHDVWIA